MVCYLLFTGVLYVVRDSIWNVCEYTSHIIHNMYCSTRRYCTAQLIHSMRVCHTGDIFRCCKSFHRKNYLKSAIFDGKKSKFESPCRNIWYRTSACIWLAFCVPVKISEVCKHTERQKLAEFRLEWHHSDRSRVWQVRLRFCYWVAILPT